jgi:hypothetical protein
MWFFVGQHSPDDVMEIVDVDLVHALAGTLGTRAAVLRASHSSDATFGKRATGTRLDVYLFCVSVNAVVCRAPEDYSRNVTQVRGMHEKIVGGHNHVEPSE